jgi:DNA-binding MarR family transcriptional regulator
MPTAEKVARTQTGLASELRLSVMRLRRRLANERHPDNPLSLNAMAVLGALYRDGDMSPGELAAHERVQPPSMTRTVNCLEEGGYVARRPHDTDGRQVVVTLTDLGRETLLADRARRDAWLATRLRGLSPEEREALRRAAPILERLARSD